MSSMKTISLRFEIPSVSVIIAAYNEQVWLAETVSSILNSGFPCELIVVDDGSADATPRILETFGQNIRVVTHPVNRGKGAAIVSGLKSASGEIVVFCDAHLRGLTRYHLVSLVLPLVDGHAKEVLGVGIPPGANARALTIGVALTGQRAYFKDDILPLAGVMEGLGYGVETFLYAQFDRTEKAIVLLPGLVHLIKKDTSSFASAFAAYTREGIEILETVAKMRGFVPVDWIQKSKELARHLQCHLNGKVIGK